MSFASVANKGATYAPGWFLAHGDCERETREIPASKGAASGGGKYVKAGTVFPSDDNQAEGIVYEDVDVTNGNAPGSVVTKGTVVEGRITIQSAAKTALQGKGFKFVAEPSVTRPY